MGSWDEGQRGRERGGGNEVRSVKGIGVRGERVEKDGAELAAQGLVAGIGAVEEGAGEVDVEMVVDLRARVVGGQGGS